MGLSKIIVQRNGVPAEYHRITGLRVAKGGMYEIAVQSFFTKEARDEGNNPVDEQIKFISSEKIDKLIAAQYELIKALPEFEGAEDVIEKNKGEK